MVAISSTEIVLHRSHQKDYYQQRTDSIMLNFIRTDKGTHSRLHYANRIAEGKKGTQFTSDKNARHTYVGRRLSK